jgi:hypothetical protein
MLLVSAIYLFLMGLGFKTQGFVLAKQALLLLEPHLQCILLWFILEMGVSRTIVPIVSNVDPPDLSLPSSCDITGVNHRCLACI